jgi:hypothetical protein
MSIDHKIIKGTVPVWFTSSYRGPDDLERGAANAISSVTFYEPGTEPDGTPRIPDGWTLVGEADVVLRIFDKRQLVTNKIDSLRAEHTQVLAEAEARATKIQSRIQQLLAIEYTERKQ